MYDGLNHRHVSSALEYQEQRISTPTLRHGFVTWLQKHVARSKTGFNTCHQKHLTGPALLVLELGLRGQDGAKAQREDNFFLFFLNYNWTHLNQPFLSFLPF